LGTHGDEEVGEIGERSAARLIEEEEQGLVVSGHAVARARELLDEAGPHEPQERPQVSKPRLGDLEIDSVWSRSSAAGSISVPFIVARVTGDGRAVAEGDEGLPGARERPRAPVPVGPHPVGEGGIDLGQHPKGPRSATADGAGDEREDGLLRFLGGEQEAPGVLAPVSLVLGIITDGRGRAAGGRPRCAPRRWGRTGGWGNGTPPKNVVPPSGGGVRLPVE
jgi:hypothetical protein